MLCVMPRMDDEITKQSYLNGINKEIMGLLNVFNVDMET